MKKILVNLGFTAFFSACLFAGDTASQGVEELDITAPQQKIAPALGIENTHPLAPELWFNILSFLKDPKDVEQFSKTSALNATRANEFTRKDTWKTLTLEEAHERLKKGDNHRDPHLVRVIRNNVKRTKESFNLHTNKEYLSLVLEQFPQLETLDFTKMRDCFSRPTIISAQTLQVIAEKSKNLKNLHTYGRHLGPDDLKHLTTLQNLENLTIFNAVFLGDNSIKELQKLPNLKYLEIDGAASITNEALSYLSKIPTLEELTISGSRNVDNTGVECLKNSNLKILRISDCPNVNWFAFRQWLVAADCTLEQLHVAGDFSKTGYGLLNSTFKGHTNTQIYKMSMSWPHISIPIIL